MTNITFDMTNLTNPQPGTVHPIITTDLLRQLCKVMDDQAYYAAITGFILSLIAIGYFGKLRGYMEKNIKEKKTREFSIAFCDKFILTGMSMAFVIIIVRLLRAS